jgi:hypothetical protein
VNRAGIELEHGEFDKDVPCKFSIYYIGEIGVRQWV